MSKKRVKKHYWYEVRYIYCKNGSQIFSFVRQIGLTEKKLTLNRREVKKAIKPLHDDRSLAYYLCNAKLDVEFMCYLGGF